MEQVPAKVLEMFYDNLISSGTKIGIKVMLSHLRFTIT